MKYLWITILTVMLAGPVSDKAAKPVGMLDNAARAQRHPTVYTAHARAEANRGVHQASLCALLRDGRPCPSHGPTSGRSWTWATDRRYADSPPTGWTRTGRTSACTCSSKNQKTRAGCRELKGPTNCPPLQVGEKCGNVSTNITRIAMCLRRCPREPHPVPFSDESTRSDKSW